MKRLGLLLLLQLAFSLTIVAQTKHNVKKGETMESIANEYGIKLAQLKQANPGLFNVHKGQVINIPVAKISKVQTETSKSGKTSMNPSMSSKKVTPDKKFQTSNTTKNTPLTMTQLRAKEREKAEKKARRKEKWQKFKEFVSPLTNAVGSALLEVANEQIVAGATSFTNSLTGKQDDGHEIYRSGGTSGYDSGHEYSSASAGRSSNESFTGTPMNPKSGTLNIDRQLERIAVYDAELDRMSNWCNERAEEVKGTGKPMASSNNRGGSGSRRAQNRASSTPAGAVTVAQRVNSKAYRQLGNLSEDGQHTFMRVQDLTKYGKNSALSYIRSLKGLVKSDANWLRNLKSQGYTTVTAEEYHTKHARQHEREMRKIEAKKQQRYKRSYDRTMKDRNDVMNNPEKYENPGRLLEEYNKKLEDLLEKME